jgi:hypothetical protein
MGCMSSSDAAPLPRLGEVFFDVRGNSRSMRLSWYADTGVAVLSIWQGGMCTGTFRLAIADLPRMVETLQRGPGGKRPDWDGDVAGQAPAEAPGRPLEPVPAMPPPPGVAGGRDDRLAGSPGGPRTGVAEYDVGPPDDPGSVSTQYLPGPRDYGADPSDHAADYRARVPAAEATSPDYLAGPPDHRAPSPGYAADPLGYPAARPDYLAGPPGHRAGPPEHGAAPPEPGGGSVNYLAGPAGYPAEPPAYRSSWNPGADRAYPRDTDAAGYAEHGYPDGAGPSDYRGESPAPDYRAGSSASGDGDAVGRSGADYPEHYAATVTDDIAHGPAPDSFPYGRPPAPRRGARRHAAPDTRYN